MLDEVETVNVTLWAPFGRSVTDDMLSVAMGPVGLTEGVEKVTV